MGDPIIDCTQKTHEKDPEGLKPAAVTKAIWPTGEALDLCLPCAIQAANVAKVMGFQLAFVPKGTPVQRTPHV